MNIKNILKELIVYFDSTRQVGHTTATIKGAENCDCIVLTHDTKFSIYLAKEYKVKTLPIDSQSLRGRKTPIVFDNAALHTIFAKSLDTINRQEKEIENLNRKLDAIKDILKY